MTIDELVSYDPQTGVFTNKVTRGRARAGEPTGGLDSDGYLEAIIAGQRYKLHRLAWEMHYGSEPTGWIDHVNGDRTDNRITNLRLATPSQNQQNKKLRKDNRQGLKGVRRQQRGKKYAAVILNKQIGTFDCPAAAHFSYQIAADKLFGKFARRV